MPTTADLAEISSIFERGNKMKKYTIKLKYDKAAAVWIATSKDIHGLILKHESADTLLDNVGLAILDLLAFKGVKRTSWFASRKFRKKSARNRQKAAKHANRDFATRRYTLQILDLQKSRKLRRYRKFQKVRIKWIKTQL